MKEITQLICEQKLVQFNQAKLNQIKTEAECNFVRHNSQIYRQSLYYKTDILYFIGKEDNEKALYLAGRKNFSSPFREKIEFINPIYIQKIALNYDNYLILAHIFPFIRPVSLRGKKTTLGCGDRLGLATAGHLMAIKNYNVYPVLAQQSIRELNFLNRTYQDVVACAAFQVFQAGYEDGYGADGDHLKTMSDIKLAVEIGMPMITLDLCEVMNAAAADWPAQKITAHFLQIEQPERERLLKTYQKPGHLISLNEQEIQLCAVMYWQALDFAGKADRFLKEKRGSHYDLEISIDETTTPTLPQHHYFIICELLHRNIQVNSVAPRFIGQFQKGVEYEGDLQEFERQFKAHCLIARDKGEYKISIHSGSDKFMIYPIAGQYTRHKLHLKTCGTSWLEAVRCISRVNPGLYRKIHSKAFHYYAEAKNQYHIDIDFSRIQDIETMNDSQLPNYLEQPDARKLIHITFGGLLTDPEIKDEFYATLIQHEDDYNLLLKNHFIRHISGLGINPGKGE